MTSLGSMTSTKWAQIYESLLQLLRLPVDEVQQAVEQVGKAIPRKLVTDPIGGALEPEPLNLGSTIVDIGQHRLAHPSQKGHPHLPVEARGKRRVDHVFRQQPAEPSKGLLADVALLDEGDGHQDVGQVVRLPPLGAAIVLSPLHAPHVRFKLGEIEL